MLVRDGGRLGALAVACEHDAARPTVMVVTGSNSLLFGRTNSCVVRPSLAFDSFIMHCYFLEYSCIQAQNYFFMILFTVFYLFSFFFSVMFHFIWG